MIVQREETLDRIDLGKPYFDNGRQRIYHGDNADFPVEPEAVGLLLADPPYGMNWDVDSGRFTHADGNYRGRRGAQYSPVARDDRSFDPTRWLDYPKVILWGANHYANRLPVGSTLVWVKVHAHMYGKFLSDAEIGWQSGGHGVYVFDKPFPVQTRRNETGSKFSVHPTQKPESLMRWCIERSRTEGIVFDPYCGSGTTLVAAMMEDRPAIGVEIDESYCRVAAERLRQGRLF